MWVVPGRTFAIGDIHGDIEAVYRLLACFPELNADDTLVFVGDYIDRGPKSKCRSMKPRRCASRWPPAKPLFITLTLSTVRRQTDLIKSESP